MLLISRRDHLYFPAAFLILRYWIEFPNCLQGGLQIAVLDNTSGKCGCKCFSYRACVMKAITGAAVKIFFKF